MIMIGVDPGLTGAISLLHSERGLLDCIDIPTVGNGTSTGSMKRWVDVEMLRARLIEWATRFDFVQESIHATIERPIPMPSLPAQTIASQFDSFGALRAALAAKVGPAHNRFVNPREWKTFYGLGKEKSESRACCLRLYADAAVTRAKDHNRAESILIGHFGMRCMA